MIRLRHLLPLALVACNPATTRPAFTPLPEAPSAAVAQPVGPATEQLAAALQADGVPLARVAPRDGYVESPWFDARSGQPRAHGAAGAAGTDVVRVRGWVDPIDRTRSTLTVEAVYHAVTDPSLPPRELDRPLPPQHPLALRLRHTLDSLAGRSEPRPRAAPAVPIAPATPGAPAAPISPAARDSSHARPDST